jgi:type I restriction enzyme S subunit
MNERKAPEIRFKGFTDDWEQRKLNEVAEKICVGFVGTCEKFYTDESGVPMYRTGNLNGLSLNRDDLKYVTNEFHQHNQKSQLKAGDILIARHGDSGKAVNYESSEEANCLNIVIIRPDFKKCNYKFLTNCINSPECQKHIKSLSAGSTQAVINTSEIEKLGVIMPANIDEQNRIARYFSNLDNLITLHQRKHKKLLSVKKSMFEKMFPQNGAKVPEIRFEGFTDDWEQRTLSDVVDIGSGMDYKHLGEGDIPVYGTGGYMLSVDAALSEDKDAIGIGRKGTIDKPYILRAPFWTVDTLFYCIPKDGYDLDFTSCLFQNVDWKKKDESTGVPSLSKVIINNVETAAPSYEEQRKIGAYFKNLDNLITLHQRELDKLVNIKKSMLEKMFV